MSDEEPTRRERIKKHVKKHKNKYLICAGGIGCMGAGFLMRPQVVNVVDAFNIKYKSPTTTNVITMLERRACPDPIPVRDKDTGEVFASMKRAAEMTKTAYAAIRNDVHGAQDRWEQLPDSVLA